MTDKEKIKEEIERLYNLYELANDYQRMGACSTILDFIDSLPKESGCEVNCTTKSEDLDFLAISLEETIGTSPHSREVIKEHLQKAVEGQKQQQEKQMNVAEYEKGLFDMREEMMKGAIDCSIIIHPNDRFANYSISAYVPPLHPASTYISNGDKVKIIIVKTEQQ